MARLLRGIQGGPLPQAGRQLHWAPGSVQHLLSPVTSPLARLGLERQAVGRDPRPRALDPRNKKKGQRRDGSLVSFLGPQLGEGRSRSLSGPGTGQIFQGYHFPLQGPLCLHCTQECDLCPTGGSG